jgi:putative redox protein
LVSTRKESGMQETTRAGEAAVEVTGDASGFAQQIAIGSHRITADEPVAVGGTATGPTPYQLLLAALGSCTSMTVAMYARRKAWPLTSVSVTLSHEKSHAADCANCESGGAQLDLIDRRLALEGPLSDEQRERLLDIANRCPVHRTLASQMKIVTRLV